MSQHIGPRVISATGGSIKRVGNYRIHTFPSELVTDGLVLNLDAGDPRSYPGSGTTWTDLSGYGNNGTFGATTTAPGYTNQSGGSLVFDNNDIITVPMAGLRPTSAITQECWVLLTNNTAQVFIGAQYGSGSVNSYALWLDGTNNLTAGVNTTGTLNSQTHNTSLSTNVWYHFVHTYDGINQRLYLNGSLVSTWATTGSILYDVNNTLLAVGNDWNSGYNSGASLGIQGRLSSVKIYNRALSALEVAQNYDALKVRYTGYTNTFIPLCAGNSGKVEVLCVAGGGGGGKNHGGGGGGAGGLIYNSAFTVNSNSAISLSIGAGGQEQNNGSNTTFSSLTSIGGGAGGTEGNSSGNSGGSGGGGAGNATSTTGGSGTSGQGFAGGRGGFPNTDNTYGHGGGGGGAGGAGTDGTEGNGATAGTAGNGGNGLSYSISGTSQFYAGGGGGGFWGYINSGGLGGSGIGGRGGENGSNANTRHGGNAVPNTGSGGGGSPGLPDQNNNRIGGNGSNGIVIVRYPASDYNVELLVVGGGGGGGVCYGGGGGAGGLLYYSSYPVSAGTRYTVTIGAGGLNRVNVSGNGFNGNNSSFGPLVAFGGGYGGGNCGTVGGNGGSGGGGSGSGAVGFAGGFGISGQGNIGATSSAADGGGGGGGAGAPGSGRQGGIGLAYSIDGTSRYYAGGGSGSGSPSLTGGLGGGGTGGTALNAGVGDGTANTGGGGGGSIIASNVGTSGIGGSGIVIIAYRGPQRGIGGTVDTTSRPGYTLHRFTTIGTDFFIP